MAEKANELPDRALVVKDDGPQADDDRFEHIRQRFNVHLSFWSNIHDEGRKDDKFVAGEQWPETIRREREEARRPVLTYNLMPSFTRQITNKMRQERPQMKVVPVESNRGNNPRLPNIQNTKDYLLADIYNGIIKNIEHISRADQAYDTAAKHAVDHGFGYFYLMNEWSKSDPFVQELRIHRVKNSYSVMMDPDAQEIDYRDAQDAFIFTDVNKATFEKKYPEADTTIFAGPGIGSSYDGWYQPDSVRVAQYLWIEYKDDEVAQLSNGKTVWISEVEDVLDELEEEEGIYILSDDDGDEIRKKVKRPVCMWQKMTANTILEGPVELPFSAIPIFPVLGEELLVDGRIVYESAIRHARDPQRSYNYWRTAAAETVALAPKAPWVGTERQFEGHEQEWESANTDNYPYLTYNHVEGVPMPQRNFPQSVAAAELSNATQDGADMQTIIGLHDASLGRDGNEKSGKAILARQNQGNTATFQFPDNLARAQQQCARLIVEAVPKLYDTQRIIRIRLPDDTDDFVELNQSVRDDDTGKTVLVHDIAYGRYDVVIDTGPNYQTQRQEAADLQMELLKVLGPDRAANIVHLIVKNLGVPGSDEVASVLRKMLPDQLKSEDEKLADLPKGVTKGEDGQLMKDGQPWQPDPTPEMLMAQKQQQIEEGKIQAAMADNQAKMATADADKAQAEAKKADAQAKIAKAQKEMAELQKPTQDDGQARQQDNERLMKGVDQIIRQVMKEHEQNPEAHKAATSEMVADAVVEALKRVKGYVDRTVGSSNPKITQNGGRVPVAPGAPSSERNGAGVNIQVGRKPGKIVFKYDRDGNIIAAMPEYQGSDGKVVNIESDEAEED